MRRSLLYILFGVFPLGILLLGTPQAAAQPSSGEITGLDVVLLIDHSGSMWGSRVHPRANDPNQHRVAAAQMILQSLAEHVERPTDFVHRVSVIGFGSTASVALSNHEIRYDPSNPGQAMRETSILAENRIEGRKMGDTNTLAAFELALGELETMAEDPPRNGRRRVVLLITDGRPYTEGRSLAAMREELRALNRDLSGAGAELWVIGLNDVSNYWNTGDGAFWEELSGPGQTRLAETASTDIAPIASDILADWLKAGPSTTVRGDTYTCPPYLGRLVFTVNFSEPRAQIRIVNPEGRPVSVDSRPRPPGTFARYVIDDPMPGTYRFEKERSRSYTINAVTYAPDIQRLQPARTVNLDTETRIVFQVRARAREPIEPRPDWPIDASVEITTPSGDQKKRSATYQGNGRFAANWTPTTPGTHQVHLRGVVTMDDGTDVDVFSATGYSYDEDVEVSRLRPVRLKLDVPQPTETASVPPWQDSVRVRLRLLDTDDAPVNTPSRLVEAPSTWLHLERIHRSGTALTDPVPLTPTADSAFAATLPLAVDWRTGEGWWRPGRFNIRVRPQPDRLRDKRVLGAIQLPDAIAENRVGGDPMTVANLTVRWPLWMLGGVLLGVLFLVAGALYWAAPRMLYWLRDSWSGRRITLKIGESSMIDLEAKTFPLSKRYRLNLDQTIRLSDGSGKEWVADTFRVRRDGSGRYVTVTVRYSWKDEPDEKKMRLRASEKKSKSKALKGPSGYVVMLEVEA